MAKMQLIRFPVVYVRYAYLHCELIADKLLVVSAKSKK